LGEKSEFAMFGKKNRVQTFVNIGLLCGNALVFVVLLRSWLISEGREMSQARKDAENLGMDIYFAKDPFAIFVAKTFPQTHTFKVFDYPNLLIMNGSAIQDDRHDAATEEAEIILGPDFSITCRYSLSNIDGARKPRIHEVLLSINEDAFYDLNADGSYDLRILHDSERGSHSHEIWYDGQWRGVIAKGQSSTYERELPAIGVVTFDRETGRWTSVKE
jgi:hypothetical protein